MPMLTTHADVIAPEITRSGSFTTIRWDRGVQLQLDADEWDALVDAIAATTVLSTGVEARALVRDEAVVRADAEVREGL